MKRDWTVPLDLPERLQSGDHAPVDVNEAQQAFVDAETHLRHFGGTVIVGAHRVEFGEERWITVGYQFRWESYAPGIRQEASVVEDISEEPVEDLEPVG